MNLYEMTGAAAQLYALLDGAEIDEQTVADTLESIGVEDKLEDYAKVIRQLEADAASADAEIKRLQAAKKRAESNAQRCKDAVKGYLLTVGKDTLKAGVFAYRVTHSTAVQITDESALPTDFTVPQPAKVDKAALLKALRYGRTINGATLQENTSLTLK